MGAQAAMTAQTGNNPMSDQLHRFTFEHLGIRGEIVSLAASWQAVVERHDYPPVVRDYLGQALAATVLLSGTIKYRGSLILQLQGDGPLRTLVAQATDRRTIRGMARATGDVEAGDLKSAFGTGHMALTAESPGGERYQDSDDYAYLGINNNFWSTTIGPETNPLGVRMYYDSEIFHMSEFHKGRGLSVRCVKN